MTLLLVVVGSVLSILLFSRDADLLGRRELVELLAVGLVNLGSVAAFATLYADSTEKNQDRLATACLAATVCLALIVGTFRVRVRRRSKRGEGPGSLEGGWPPAVFSSKDQIFGGYRYRAVYARDREDGTPEEALLPVVGFGPLGGPSGRAVVISSNGKAAFYDAAAEADLEELPGCGWEFQHLRLRDEKVS